MKKIIICILFSLFSFTVNADHKNDMSNYYFTQVPILCGKPENINKYLNHYNFKTDSISLGREGMEKDGQPVYMVTYYISEDGTQTTVTIDVSSGLEKCILFHSFDLTKPIE